MVVYEGDGALGIVANDTRWLAILIAQAPVLAVLDSLLQDALRGEVKGGGGAGCPVDPVHHCLPGVVLVVVQLSAIPPEHMPALAPSHSRLLYICNKHTQRQGHATASQRLMHRPEVIFFQ